MRYNKFVILYTSNFCKRISDFFCVGEWINSGYNVEYWDLSAITCHEKLADFSVEGLVVRKLVSNAEFEQAVRDNNCTNTLYLTWVNYCWYSACFYEILSMYNCEYAFCDNGIVPTPRVPRTNLTLKKLYRSVQARYYILRSKTNKLKAPAYYFKLSETVNAGPDKLSEETKIGWCNSGDYESNRKLVKVEEGDYIVFLDQYIPYHNDYILQGDKPLSPENYYDSLNVAFDSIEKHYGMPVIIAAHPAAQNYKDKNPYNGRKLVYNKATELVHYSFAVIAHDSTAISFGIMNFKKIMLLTSNELNRTLVNDRCFMELFADLLDIPLYNIDKDHDLLFKDINNTNYESYIYSYLTNRHSCSMTNFKSFISLIGSQEV